MKQKDFSKKRNKNGDSEGYVGKSEFNNGIDYKKNQNTYLDDCVDNYHKQKKSDNETNWYNPRRDREPNGELQVVLNGNVVTILKQQIKTNQKRQNRKYSDQETYAMSNNISGPKFSDIPCPQFLNI
ncbi:unnamed protein product (macronuclear) [Paramecium tetraurelia]|uniref:Chromosome undetermined scaffold_1, whole genome shotgun sequence n=1 Tax=Paramecium tetraurelia TaxID=5888 RepID=Q6BGI8_PARTE|nr:hypothetical protein [Paramecium tetraurelia strain d4-2]XP_001423486.1 uncharacterized protein GSPATT00000524001 [Paramecium tetraurelia]CAH03232.1 hypothetical protein PTMB.35c [Paramecium tetraurelia]CAK56088.1 unnamed protein product [Paramecium tetraurelia]|eukprot:XP_001423486.1 hypothetical protein (macronuclear) [Paramecium tetraurelia strain d4-2]